MKFQRQLNSSIGPLFLVASDIGLHGVFWSEQNYPEAQADSPSAHLLTQASSEIIEFLAGQRKSFQVPINPEGSAFQLKVWNFLRTIPYGKTLSYQEVALALGSRGASRAVGTANAKNPLCLLIPCHRVISSDGSLGGYSGGIDTKAHLLNLEAKNPGQL